MVIIIMSDTFKDAAICLLLCFCPGINHRVVSYIKDENSGRSE